MTDFTYETTKRAAMRGLWQERAVFYRKARVAPFRTSKLRYVELDNKGKMVGYLKLRHGEAAYPHVGASKRIVRVSLHVVGEPFPS